jgi:hypothetical protein
MTSRERVLATFVAPLLVVIGGGLMAYMFVLKPIWEGDARIKAAEDELTEKKTKEAEEKLEAGRLRKLDPRLGSAQRWSVPESPDRAVLAHNTRMQDEYLRFLNEQFKKAGLTMGSVPKVAEPDANGAPQLANKTPLYTRFIFNLEAEGTYDALMRVLEEFQKTPLLQKVSKLEITKPTVATTGGARGGAAAPGGAGARNGPGGAQAGPGAGFAGGGFPGAGFPGAGPGAGPGGPAAAAGGRGGRGGNNTNLKILMTVELLQVNGAEKRYTLLPYSLAYGAVWGPAQTALYTTPGTAHPPRVLAQPDRIYSDMLAKNIFFGQAKLNDKLTSDHFEPLRFNKLVCIRRTGYGRYEGMVYDQRKPVPNEKESEVALDQRNDHRYTYLRATKAVDFKVEDEYQNEILLIRVVDITPDEIHFKVVSASANAKRITEKKAFPLNKSLTTDRPLLSDDPEQVYRMHIGDFFTDALASRFTPPRTDPEKTDKGEKTDKKDPPVKADKVEQGAKTAGSP